MWLDWLTASSPPNLLVKVFTSHDIYLPVFVTSELVDLERGERWHCLGGGIN